MSIVLTIPDIPTDNAGFMDLFQSYTVRKERDGKGGFVLQGTVSLRLPDDKGQPYKDVSDTLDLPLAAAASLRDFIKTHHLTRIKEKEGL